MYFITYKHYKFLYKHILYILYKHYIINSSRLNMSVSPKTSGIFIRIVLHLYHISFISKEWVGTQILERWELQALELE